MAESKSGAGRIEAAATVSWRGWGGEVTGGSGVLKVATATQVELGGPGQATNPEELLAAALANCYTSTITARVSTWARSILRALAWDATTPHHIAEGALSVRIRSAATEQAVLDLAREARDHCPICNVLGATAKVTLSVSVLPAGQADR